MLYLVLRILGALCGLCIVFTGFFGAFHLKDLAQRTEMTVDEVSMKCLLIILAGVALIVLAEFEVLKMVCVFLSRLCTGDSMDGLRERVSRAKIELSRAKRELRNARKSRSKGSDKATGAKR